MVQKCKNREELGCRENEKEPRRVAGLLVYCSVNVLSISQPGSVSSRSYAYRQ